MCNMNIVPWINVFPKFWYIVNKYMWIIHIPLILVITRNTLLFIVIAKHIDHIIKIGIHLCSMECFVLFTVTLYVCSFHFQSCFVIWHYSILVSIYKFWWGLFVIRVNVFLPMVHKWKDLMMIKRHYLISIRLIWWLYQSPLILRSDQYKNKWLSKCDVFTALLY